MTYKDIAVKNEQKLKQKNLRWATLLYNALILLEEQYNPLQLQEHLGMTHAEYNSIMYWGEE
jgi:hypothetical protein